MPWTPRRKFRTRLQARLRQERRLRLAQPERCETLQRSKSRPTTIGLTQCLDQTHHLMTRSTPTTHLNPRIHGPHSATKPRLSRIDNAVRTLPRRHSMPGTPRCDALSKTRHPTTKTTFPLRSYSNAQLGSRQRLLYPGPELRCEKPKNAKQEQSSLRNNAALLASPNQHALRACTLTTKRLLSFATFLAPLAVLKAPLLGQTTTL